MGSGLDRALHMRIREDILCSTQILQVSLQQLLDDQAAAQK